MSKKTLSISLKTQQKNLLIDRLLIAGWVGKDNEALQKHIDELAELGIAPPGRTPTYMNLCPDILTTADMVPVVGAESSGEVEAVVISDRDGSLYLGVGSDHTDREFEKYSIPVSKQMCSKPIAGEVWPFAEVEDHLDSLILRSWMTNSQRERKLYQEGCLSENWSISELLKGIPSGCVVPGESFCLFCGTFAAIGGLEYGDYFEFELHDPVLERQIRHAYRVELLPQFV